MCLQSSEGNKHLDRMITSLAKIKTQTIKFKTGFTNNKRFTDNYTARCRQQAPQGVQTSGTYQCKNLGVKELAYACPTMSYIHLVIF